MNAETDSAILALRRAKRQALGLLSSLPLLGWPAASALAQFRVEVTGVGLTRFPFSAVSFRGNDAASENIAAIVRADLERSGLFVFVPPVPGALDQQLFY